MSRKKQSVEVDNAASVAAAQAQTAAVQAQTKALEDQAASFKKAQEAQMAASTLASNMQADLKNDNVGTVIAGGSADVADVANPNTSTYKRRRSGSLSSQLGVNA